MNFAGIDIGSRAVKVAIISDGRIISQYMDNIGVDSMNPSIKCTEEALKQVGLTIKDLTCTVSTGYGRALIPFADKHISDIAAHARGAVWSFPTGRTILDIGGQDSKAINCSEGGRVIRFVMNEKCAGGSGRFLEVMADLLGVSLEEMGSASLNSPKKTALTSTCVIFAKSEALGLLLEGTEKNDVIAAINRSIAIQSCKLLGKMLQEKDLVLTGGVNKNSGIVKAIKEISNMEPLIPPDPQMVGAIGAAATAMDIYGAKQKQRK